MTYDLKPCPFCGGSEVAIVGGAIVYMMCNCTASGPEDTNCANAVTAWNTRTDNPNELEELRALLAISRLNGSWDEHPDCDRVDVLLNTPSKETNK